MQAPASPRLNGAVPNVPASEPPASSCCSSCCQKVCFIAKATFLSIIGLGLFIVNPSFSFAGFIIGIIFVDQVNDGIQRIIQVWQSQKIITSLAIGVAAFFALPVTLAAGSLLYSAYWGSQAALAARNNRPQEVVIPN